MREMIITFDAPNRPLSINEANQLHWAARRRRLEPWRVCLNAAWRVADSADKIAVINKKVGIQVSIPFARKSRRDAHNYVGTICKALVDELVVCGLVPDDNTDYVYVDEPKLTVGGKVIVYIYERK